MLKEVSKKRKKHRAYSEDFKREAVSTYEASGKSASEICRLLDISSGVLLKQWSVVYGQKHKKRDHMTEQKSHEKTVAVKSNEKSLLKGEAHTSKPEDVAKILVLEEEIRHLRQVLGTHAVKEYLAELREESWREVTNAETAKEVERIVAKKR